MSKAKINWKHPCLYCGLICIATGLLDQFFGRYSAGIGLILLGVANLYISEMKGDRG